MNDAGKVWQVLYCQDTVGMPTLPLSIHITIAQEVCLHLQPRYIICEPICLSYDQKNLTNAE